jgi:methionyl-tRNA formyltransferase
VFQPEPDRRPEIVAQLSELAASHGGGGLGGQIILQSVIDLPRYGIINVHASLLPKYRGAAHHRAVANGETIRVSHYAHRRRAGY